jgi:presqualene diphosphate synthase
MAMSLPAAGSAEPQTVAGRSGSTFFLPMLLLPRDKRTAMFAIYAFCRQVDDIVDEPGAEEAKRNALAAWRDEVRSLYVGGAPHSPVAAGLADAIARYHLPRAELEAVIDGMAMDLAGSMRAPSLDLLRVYCRRVAGAVGLLAIRVFDRADDDSEKFAVALGDALQFTNILRDLAEDAALGRLYLPRELLIRAGILDTDPDIVLRHPALPKVCEALADMAEARFAEAMWALSGWPVRRLWTARAMMVLYHRLLTQLRERGWRDLDRKIRLPRRECAMVTLRCMLGIPPTL